MRTGKFSLFVLLLLCIGLALPALAAEDQQKESKSLHKVTGTPVKTYMNINQISTVVWNDGKTDIDINNANSGFVFPKGSRKTAIFQSGFLWGAKYGIGGEVRVGGSAYREGVQAGKILPGLVPEDPNLPKNRIYRVRPDIPPTVDRTKANVSSEVADGEGSADEIITQYIKDWNEWPATDGAPYFDKNGNGRYDAATDIPGVKGADQTIWYVANDLNASRTTYLYGSNPMGMEMQVTVWGYAQSGALGSMIFRKYLIINKSNVIFDSTYVSMWSDPDLGNSTDDFVGVDTTRSLGYVYNANAEDDTYKPLPPPAAGFDFFQGPVVSAPGDSGIFQGHRIHGKKNLPATAFYYFARGDATVTDPTQGSYEGSVQFYNFFQGKIGRTGQTFTDPNGVTTTFAMAGDPQTRQGWVDGEILPAGDRRMGLASGPFRMAPGDTQEVVVAEIAAGAIPGTDRLSAIGLLKYYDDIAQLAYNNFFELSTPPPPPKVSVANLNQQVVLDWGEDQSAVDATEGSDIKGYKFQGYNVYQLPYSTATITDAKRLATYDVVDGIGKIEDFFFDPSTGVVAKKVLQFGNDTGIKRYAPITTDAFSGGTPLINGIRYYFAVTAYNYNPDPTAVPNNKESPLAILTVVPQTTNPGTRYGMASGDTVTVQQTVLPGGAPSEGQVIPIVVDPTRLNGHSYKVLFHNNPDGTTVWDVQDLSTGEVKARNQTNQSGDDDYPIIDGMILKVLGPPAGMKDWQIPNGTRRFTWSGADGYALEGFEGAMGNSYDFWGIGVSYDKLRNVLLKLAAVPKTGVYPTGDANASYCYRFMRGAQSAPAKPEFAPFIINTTASYAFQDYVKGAPFSAWNVEVNPPQRLAIAILENNVAAGLVDGKWWGPLAGVSSYGTAGAREWFWVLDAPYTDATPNTAFETNISNDENLPLMWVSLANRRADVDWAAGDEFLILANHLNTPNNVFTFTAPANTVQNSAIAKDDVAHITVFPNPYYGVNSEELNKYQRFVTISHLPRKATIRIFSLAGLMIRKIEKESDSQFERWDLTNDSGLPVGSGLYIAYIEMPEIGATKIVKMAIVQEQQILDRF